MTTVASEYCNDKGWSHAELISNTKKRIEEVKGYYNALLNFITHEKFKPSNLSVRVTETFDHALKDLDYKLERLKVILKLLDKDPTLAQCVLDQNTINQLIVNYNKSTQSGVDTINPYNSTITAREFFKNALKESVNEGSPNRIVEKTIKYHFDKLKEFAKSNNPKSNNPKSNNPKSNNPKDLPELNIASPNIENITQYVNSACNKDCNKEDTNQVLKNAMTILIPFLKYKISTNKTVKTGGRKHKTATRKMRCRRSYRKKRKLLV